MSTQFKKRNSGLSLLETLIYIALLVVVSIVVIEAITLVFRVHKETAAAKSINTSAMVALERMTRDIRNGVSIDEANSILQTSPGKLTVVAGPVTTEFSIDNEKLLVKENGVSQGYLVAGSATTSLLKFFLISTTTSKSVKIELSLAVGSGTDHVTKNFYSTVVLRGSY